MDMDAQINGSLEDLKAGLKAFVFKRVKNKALTDDIVQDVFVKVFTRIDQLKHAEKLTAWVYQIARNTINDHYRRHAKSISPELINWESNANLLNECVARCLQQLVMTLPDKYREAFQLSEIENISQTEIADRLGISYSGTKSRVQRARQMLRNKMEALLIVETDSYGNVLTCKDRNPCCGC
jgi:RNA polymerase sigma-70 factor (ECF subfamily)